MTAAEEKLWEFIGVSSGRLCPIFKFEEEPYYLILVQVVCAFLVTLALESVGRCFSQSRQGPEYQSLTTGFDKDQMYVMYFDTKEDVEDDRHDRLCTAEVLSAEAFSDTTRWHVNLTDGPDALKGQERDITVDVAKGTFSDDIGNKDTPFSFCQVPKAKGVDPISMKAYWLYQSLMIQISFGSLSRNVHKHGDGLSLWGRYNMWAYGFVHSGIWLTGAQAMFAVVFPVIVDIIVVFSEGGFVIGQGGEARKNFVRSFIGPLIISAMPSAFFTCCVALVLGITHVLPAFVYYFWLYLPLPFVLVTVLFAGSGYVSNAAKSKLAGAKVIRADVLAIQKVTQVLAQLCVTFLFQTTVSVMVRVYAGEVAAQSYFTPLYNDFMSRTWHTLAQCALIQKSGYVDLLLKWT